jgi:hypothetical protein
MKTTIDCSDIGFDIIVSKVDEYHIEFHVHEICNGEIEEDIAIKGSVKWDGCANWWFQGLSDLAYHTCGLETIDNLSEVMRRCWNYTKDNLQTWDY